MPRTLNLPKDQALWKLVERPTRDALTKIRLYQQALEVGTAPLDAQTSVARYGYKALFANPWIATAGTLYSYKDLDGLAELVAAIQESPIIASKLGRSDPAAEDCSRQTNIHAHEVAMIPLVLALLGVPNFDVDLEFSGSVSEACFIDVAAHVPVDSGQSVAELGRCWRGVGGEQRA